MDSKGTAFYLLLLLGGVSGCGTTRWTDTPRSAPEELLISQAIDQSVSQIDFSVLAGQDVFLDTDYLGDVAYKTYLSSALRQQLLAGGCHLMAKCETAQVIVEARAGSIATAGNDKLVGIPKTMLPNMVPGMPTAIPEIALFKKTVNVGVAKVSVFAYRADNGSGIWQSGVRENQSILKNHWFFGCGPYATGDVVIRGTKPPHLFSMFHEDVCPPMITPLECEMRFGDPPPVSQPNGEKTTVQEQPRLPLEVPPAPPAKVDDPPSGTH